MANLLFHQRDNTPLPFCRMVSYCKIPIALIDFEKPEQPAPGVVEE